MNPVEFSGIQCPYCLSEFELPIDVTAGNQQWVTDCEVCCQPIQVFVTLEEDENRLNIQVERETG
ncbi:MAG: CPXCG motif-containing cysteine-rich protein [Gammaproteobacteria bacterium]|nr:MAG: CPXCG motif-containing cysteine-rich protein [Gammaproteobacteria bacterium]